MLASTFQDSKEYKARALQPYNPYPASIKQIRDVIPKSLLARNTLIGTSWVIRDFILAWLLYECATRIDSFAGALNHLHISLLLRCVLWPLYWLLQSFCWCGIWILGHEAVHGNLASQQWWNDVMGICLDTFVLTPFYSFRYSHNLHHKGANSVEREENFVPVTRKKIEQAASSRRTNYPSRLTAVLDSIEDTPICQLVILFSLQCVGWDLYLCTNFLGQPDHGPRSNHFNPYSIKFKPEHHNGIIASNITICCMIAVLVKWGISVGPSSFLKIWLMPHLIMNNWIAMLTFLQHTDPLTPRFRKEEWDFVRGALGTIDRPFLGLLGDFFLHNGPQHHTAHHFMPTAPFFNVPKITEHMKRVLGDDYSYDSTNVFYAVWRSFRDCVYIEDEGGIVFFKNKRGESQRSALDVNAKTALTRDTKINTLTSMSAD